MAIFFFCAQFLRRVPKYLLPGQGVLFRVLMKQSLDRHATLYLLESLGEVYLVGSSAQGLQVLRKFEYDEVQSLLANQNLKISELLKSKELTSD